MKIARTQQTNRDRQNIPDQRKKAVRKGSGFAEVLKEEQKKIGGGK